MSSFTRQLGYLVLVPGLALGALPAGPTSRGQETVPPAPRGASRITIDALIDIRHPSNPVWSRDSRSIAFMWERAGIADLYVVPGDGSARPRALTSGGEAVAGVSTPPCTPRPRLSHAWTASRGLCWSCTGPRT